jgi:hypothetical protein
MQPSSVWRFASAVVLSLAAHASATAQQSTQDQTRSSSYPDLPTNFFSGQIFGSYQIRTDSAARAATGGKDPNQFTIDRVYLTFQMPAGEHASIRATTDIFQNQSLGWDVRLKYGYLNYNFADTGNSKGVGVQARVGMIYTPVITQEEVFWPRYLSQVGVERFGFFHSSDLGAGVETTLPGKFGSVYGTVVNGPGYLAPENDRFKDVVLRATLAPFGSDRSFLRTLTISPWIYKGFTGSRFANGGPGQVGPVTEGLKRDRWGVFGGVTHPRFTLGGEYARRADGFEAGGNTLALPRIVTDTTGDLWSGYALVNPFQWTSKKNTSRLGAVVRLDRFRPRTNVGGSDRLLIAGVTFQPTPKTALTLDYQGLTPHDYPGAVPATLTQTKSWLLQWNATF